MTRHTVRDALIVLILAALLVIGLTARSGAITIVDQNGQTIPYAMKWEVDSYEPTPNLTVTLVPESCPQAIMALAAGSSCVSYDQPTIIYLATQRYWWDAQFVLYHEQFHTWDFSGGNRPDVVNIRNEFLRINHIHVGWRDPLGPTQPGSVPPSAAEWAAVAYSNCAWDPRDGWANAVNNSSLFTTEYGYKPTEAQFLAACRLFKNHLR